MNLTETFQTLRLRGKKALVTYVTAGDPSLDQLPAILRTLSEAGADIIEVGMPFSDPIADGPTIQASSQRALDRGVTPIAVFETLAQAHVETPIVLMGYYNTVLRMGHEAFAKRAKEAGVSGVIVVDLIAEEAGDWKAVCAANGLDTIFLAAPTSTDERLEKVARASTGFVYAVSRTGVTGATATVSEGVAALVDRIKAHTDLPVCVGFGISKPEHVREVCRSADGAVVGSWLVDLLATQWNGGSGVQVVRDAVVALNSETLP